MQSPAFPPICSISFPGASVGNCTLTGTYIFENNCFRQKLLTWKFPRGQWSEFRGSQNLGGQISHFSLNNVFKCLRQTYRIVKETNILKWSYQDILKNQMYNTNLRASLLMHKITRSSASLITSATLKQPERK